MLQLFGELAVHIEQHLGVVARGGMHRIETLPQGDLRPYGLSLAEEGAQRGLRRESNHHSNDCRYFAQMGTGIQINKSNSLDINLSGNLSFDHDEITEEILDRGTAIHSIDTSRGNPQTYWIDVYYKHNFNGPNNYFTVDANLTRGLSSSTNSRQYTYLPDSTIFNRDASPYSAWLFTTRADYYREWDKFQIQTGIIYRHSDLQNDFSFENLVDGAWLPDPLVTNGFNYTENDYVAYFTFGHQVTDKFGYTVTLNDTYIQTMGISETTGTKTPNNFNVVRPYLSLRYRPNDDHYFSINYVRNYRKPNYTYMNPFRSYESPVYYIEGNPDLSIATNHNMSLSYRYRYWLNLGVEYVNATNTVLRVPQLDTDGAIIGYTYGNFGQSDDLTFSVNMSKRFFDKRFNLGFNGISEYMRYNSGDTLNYRNSMWHFSGDLNFSYLIFKKHNVTFGGYVLYSSSRLVDYGQSTGIPKTSLDLSASFLDNNLQTTLSVNDVFNNDVGNRISNLNGVISVSDNLKDARYIRFTVRYRFNPKKVKQFNRRQGSNEDSNRL